MTKADANRPKRGKSATRDDRLAAALRENLRRRKAQARGRGAIKTAPNGDTGATKAGKKDT